MTQVHSSANMSVPSQKNLLILTGFAGILVVVSTIIFGWVVLQFALVSYVISFIVEIAFAKFRKKKLDIGWFVTPMLFTLLLPPLLPLWMAGVGAFFGVFFGKAIFGGTGRTIFNPALVGILFLYVTFPIQLTQEWIVPIIDMQAGATPLKALSGAGPYYYSIRDLLFGSQNGTIGETFRLGIIVLGLGLIVLKISDWRIPLSYLGSFFIIQWIGSLINPTLFKDPILSLLTGGILLGAFFFATDVSSAPKTSRGKLLFGLGLGILTIIIRVYATFVEGVTFSLIIMSAVSPLLDKKQIEEIEKEGEQNE